MASTTLVPAYSIGADCNALRALRTGARAQSVHCHGLPMIGNGDWNDGMNRVGEHGQRRKRVARLVPVGCSGLRARGPRARGDRTAPGLADIRRGVAPALEEHRWDGEWYLRGYYDDGSPSGTAQDEECQIDAIAQSWAVLSGAGDPDGRTRRWKRPSPAGARRGSPAAHATVHKTERDPGYIKGYPPGIRENGGQYTHGGSGRSSPTRCSAKPEAEDCSDCSTRSITRAARRRASATGWSPMWWPPTSMRLRTNRARRLDLVYRFGGLAVPGWARGDPRHLPRRQSAEGETLHP